MPGKEATKANAFLLTTLCSRLKSNAEGGQQQRAIKANAERGQQQRAVSNICFYRFLDLLTTVCSPLL
jgi:hypothetical protein